MEGWGSGDLEREEGAKAVRLDDGDEGTGMNKGNRERVSYRDGAGKRATWKAGWT